MSTIRAIKFLNSLRKKNLKVKHLCANKSQANLDIYEPQSYVGSILFLHGMSKLGKDDPRMQRMADSMALAGFRVLVPQLQTVSDLRIYSGQPDEIKHLIEETVLKETAYTKRPISLMAVSFTGIFALQALSIPCLTQHIGPVCIIGGYSRFTQVVNYLLLSRRADLYGRLLLYKNYLAVCEEGSEQLSLSIQTAMEISANIVEQKEVVAVLKSEHPRVYAELKDILVSEELKSPLKTGIKRFIGQSLNSYKLVDLNKLKKVPIFILHGRNDRVIPSGEARSLANRLGKAGFDVQLCLTKFLSHGDTSIQIKDLIPLWQLIASFSWYFDKVKSYKGSFHVESN